MRPNRRNSRVRHFHHSCGPHSGPNVCSPSRSRRRPHAVREPHIGHWRTLSKRNDEKGRRDVHIKFPRRFGRRDPLSALPDAVPCLPPSLAPHPTGELPRVEHMENVAWYDRRPTRCAASADIRVYEQRPGTRWSTCTPADAGAARQVAVPLLTVETHYALPMTAESAARSVAPFAPACPPQHRCDDIRRNDGPAPLPLLQAK